MLLNAAPGRAFSSCLPCNPGKMLPPSTTRRGGVFNASPPAAARGSRGRADRRRLGGAARRPVHDHRQPGPVDQRRERAAELAPDERGLRLPALFQAHADRSRQRAGPAARVGAGARGACRTPARTVPRTSSIRSSTTASCTRATAGAPSTRSTRGAPTAASSCGSPTRAWSTKATARGRAASRSGRTSCWRTCRTAASSPSTATPGRSSGTGEIAATTEFGGREAFRAAPLAADGKVIVQNGAGDAGTRGWVAALDVKTGAELWRWYVVPEPGEPGSETWKDDHNAWKTGGGGIWQTGSYDPQTNLYIFGTGNPLSHLRPGVSSWRQPLHELGRGRRRRDRATRLALPVHAERFVGLTTKWASTCCTTPSSTAACARSCRTTRATDSSIRSTAPAAPSSRPGSTSTTSTGTAGLDPLTGRPVDYDPNLDVQIYNPAARALRADRDTMKRACPTWHGGIAHQPDRVQPGQGDRLRRGHRGLLLAERRGGGVALAGRRRGRGGQRTPRVHQRPVLRLGHRGGHGQPTRSSPRR